MGKNWKRKKNIAQFEVSVTDSVESKADNHAIGLAERFIQTFKRTCPCLTAKTN